VTDPALLRDRVAVVTGATRGIGRAVAVGLAGAGATVVAIGRKEADLEALDDDLRAVGRPGVLVPLDLRRYSQIDQLGGALAERFRRIDILVAAAALRGKLSPVAQSDTRTWEEVIKVNLTAQYRLIRSFDPLLRAAPAGRAVFFTDGVALEPRSFFAPYAPTKAALENMVETWAMELRQTRVRVHLVDPGPRRTKMREEAYPGEKPENVPTPDDLVPDLLALLSADADSQMLRISLRPSDAPE